MIPLIFTNSSIDYNNNNNNNNNMNNFNSNMRGNNMMMNGAGMSGGRVVRNAKQLRVSLEEFYIEIFINNSTKEEVTCVKND